jgi:hypothetical protein
MQDARSRYPIRYAKEARAVGWEPEEHDEQHVEALQTAGTANPGLVDAARRAAASSPGALSVL